MPLPAQQLKAAHRALPARLLLHGLLALLVVLLVLLVALRLPPVGRARQPSPPPPLLLLLLKVPLPARLKAAHCQPRLLLLLLLVVVLLRSRQLSRVGRQAYARALTAARRPLHWL